MLLAGDCHYICQMIAGRGKRFHWLFLFVLPALGGLMLNFAWAPHQLTLLAFFALTPFFAIAVRFRHNPAGVFLALFFGFFLFHASAAWWMYSSTITGSLLAHLLNAFLPAASLIIWATLSIGHHFPARGMLLMALWLLMEWLNTVWPLAWPWFQLGHVFGSRPQWVQWYSITSSTGGTLWVLIVNYLLFLSVDSWPVIHYRRLLSGLVMIALPMLIAQRMQAPDAVGTQIATAIVQPNIHPQKEKFGGMDAMTQFRKALHLLEEIEAGSAELAVFPETMIVEPIDEASIDENVFIRMIRGAMQTYGLKGVITGAFTKRTSGWHPSDDANTTGWPAPFVLYNSLILIREYSVEIYHKEKLVPLVEKLPFLWFMKPFRAFIEESGGFFGSYGTYNNQYHLDIDGQKAAVPLICFESAFSCFPQPVPLPSFVVLVTNDGWWSSSGGYLQHLNLARLRAIERGQWIVRAANTGISGLINPRGEMLRTIDYGMEGVITVNAIAFPNKHSISCSVQKWIRWTAFSCFLGLLLVAVINKRR